MNVRKPTNAEERESRVPLVEAISDLYATVERKCRRLRLLNPLGGDRGTLCTQVVEDRLFIMEAGFRATLYPRAVYAFDVTCSGEPHVYYAQKALRMERASDALVARRDTRPPVTLIGFDSNLDARPALDSSGNGGGYTQEEHTKRAERLVRQAKRNLELAMEQLARAQSRHA